MARTRARMFLVLAVVGIFCLDVSVRGELQGEQQEEEERSCQGAFDLYFVLDKWVSDIIYCFVNFWSLRIAMQPCSCLETRSASVGPPDVTESEKSEWACKVEKIPRVFILIKLTFAPNHKIES